MTLSFPSPRHPLPDYPCRGLNWRRGFGLGVLLPLALPGEGHTYEQSACYPPRDFADRHGAERLLRDVQSYLTRREA